MKRRTYSILRFIDEFWDSRNGNSLCTIEGNAIDDKLISKFDSNHYIKKKKQAWLRFATLINRIAWAGPFDLSEQCLRVTYSGFIGALSFSAISRYHLIWILRKIRYRLIRFKIGFRNYTSFFISNKWNYKKMRKLNP